MEEKIKLYRDAARRSVEWQLSFQLPDGGYIWDGYANDAFHKQGYAWGIAGYPEPTHRLYTWARDKMLQPDGQLANYAGDVYKLSWFFQGAHRLGRFDVSYPVMNWLMTCQANCGGLPHFAGDKYLRSLSTCWTGISAIYFGRVDVAQRTAEWAISMYHQQPVADKFYFTTTRDGRLVTPDIDPGAQCIDTAQQKQCYWEVGLPLQLMCRLYQVTGSTRYLDYAKRFFEFGLTCAEDRFTYVGAGKSSLGAAQYYLLTGDERALNACLTFCDNLLETQHVDGGWRDISEPDILLIYIDHGAEFTVWLNEISSLLPGAKARWGG